MSYIVFDFACSRCGHHVDNELVSRSAMDAQICPKCHLGGLDQLMERLPAGTRTTFRFHDRSASKR